MPSVLEPLQVRARRAPSRIMFGPVVTNLAYHRTIGASHVELLRRRVAGGAGIVVVEEAAVHESDHPYERSPLADRCGAGWASTVAGCRDAGEALVLAGIGHAGGQGTSHWHQRELWAPSAVPEVNTREVPKVMEAEDIAVVVAGFGGAAKLAAEAGLDGVEVNVGQHSLVRQFLSGLTNLRDDAYGADRMRFAKEVLAAVRSGVGADRIVALRLSVDELAPWAGIVPEAGAAIAVELAPFVDLVTVVRGGIFSVQATRPDGHEPQGFGVALAAQVRMALRDAGHEMPVVAQGSIVDPAMADDIVRDGRADAVEMTRALLADADLPRKHAAGRRPRPCLLCNQTCQGRDNRNPVVTCVVDPRSGHELSDPDPDTATGLSGAQVTVVGGGIAGLEAARVAATRGAAVRVLEAGPSTGGAVRAAARGAGRGGLADIADWLASECDRLGVTIETGRPVTDDELDHLRADGPVIVATGGVGGPLPFDVDVDAGAVVLHAADLLGGVVGHGDLARLGEGPVAVWDPIGGPIAISVAELLASGGRRVVLISPDLLVGEKLSLTGDLAPAQNRLAAAQVEIVKDTLVRRVHRVGVTVEHRWTGAVTEIDATALIACGHRLPDRTIDPDERFPQAGDRVAPRTIHEAILEGRRRAMELQG